MGEGKEFIGKSIREALREGARCYGVSEEKLKFSILEERKDPETGELLEMRLWIDRPEPDSILLTSSMAGGHCGIIKSAVVDLLKAARLNLDANIYEHESHFEIDLSGKDREFIMDRHGDFLDALQYVITKMVSKNTRVNKKIIVDSERFRQKRSEELVEIALHAAEKVKKMGEDYHLGPLNPYERRVIHVALSQIPGVKTFSTGDGFLKKITISLCNDK
ncbi:MAG: R3H domain-containing nucleic acid-binding protein [Acidobacteriota bacterium]